MDLFIFKIAFQGLRGFFLTELLWFVGFFITTYNHISLVSLPLLSEEINFFLNCSFFPCYHRRKINHGVQQSNYNLRYIIMNMIWLQRKVKIKASNHGTSRFLSKTSFKQVSLNKRYSLKRAKQKHWRPQCKKKVSSTWRRQIGRERRNSQEHNACQDPIAGPGWYGKKWRGLQRFKMQVTEVKTDRSVLPVILLQPSPSSSKRLQTEEVTSEKLAVS